MHATRQTTRQQTQRGKKSSLRRGGYLTMELVLTLPILAIVLLALFEFSLLFFARGVVVESCRAGARQGTMPGATTQSVEAEIKRVLTPSLIPGLQVNYLPGQYSGDVVQVAVRIPMTDASPDLLWPVGFSLRNRDLFAEVSMIKE